MCILKREQRSRVFERETETGYSSLLAVPSRPRRCLLIV
jgi:hypothetical protein